ncbi:hypothetical protein VF21_04169 [Pseudogymnoascus sp. 05NY08]|nr:hypothetical protein VF21_04169 [Pseudogymnoascus sp. 05NY08]
MATLKDRTKSAVAAAATAAASKLKKKRMSFQPTSAQSPLPDDPDVHVKAGEPVTVTQEPPPQQRFPDLETEKKTGGRRLIIACDGTWTNSYSDAPTANALADLLPNIFSHITVTLPSNITRICRALNTSAVATEDTEPCPAQIVFYHPGIGTDGGIEDRIIGGATGATISLHISECYGFICNNWQVGDEIFLFGFSRGAYTARAIATLITDIGLLTTKGMEFFFQIFEDWKNQNVPEVLEKQIKEEKLNGARGAFKGLPATPPMPSKAYTDELAKRGYTRPSVPVKVLGVFDTVGALGVPPIFGLHISATELMQYSFVNTKVSQVVEYAFQALALDDHRAAFAPAVWEQPQQPAALKTLAQAWFPGVHSNIGGAGGYDDQSLANDTLAWMLAQLQTLDVSGNGLPLLDFDKSYLDWIFALNVAHCNNTPSVGGYRGWALGKMDETLTTAYSFVGDVKPWAGWENWRDWAHPGDLARTPGQYESYSAKSGRRTKRDRPLVGSNETIHPSARVRVACGGKGLDDKGAYYPRGLENFKIVGPEGADMKDPLAVGFKWVGKDSHGRDVVLEETKLGAMELVLLEASRKAVEEGEARKGVRAQEVEWQKGEVEGVVNGKGE